MSNSIEKLLEVKKITTSGSNETNNIKNTVLNINTFKLAIVVDVINDENHPIFIENNPNKVKLKLGISPANYKSADSSINSALSIPTSEDADFSYIGRAKIRVLEGENKSPKERLPWAIPLDKTITQYPLLNEFVMVIKVGENFYYTKPFNTFNFTGVNADFSPESSSGDGGNGAVPYGAIPNMRSYLTHPTIASIGNKIGYLGNYFIINPFIRSLKTYEGDTLIESRFGQSIKFSTYDDDRLKDQSFGNTRNALSSWNSDNQKGNRIDFGYTSYTLDKNLYPESSKGGYGNPKITIRNRQRNISIDREQRLHPKLPPIPAITNKEKNYGGSIEQDINNDGSTIEISSGTTVTTWKTTVYKSIFAVGSEEQTQFTPDGCTNFVLPIFDKDQIVINTDRLIFSSRFSETLHFSKKRYSIVTDAEYTVDSHNQIVLTTNYLTCLNSPQIFLGQYGDTNEPALLGQTTVDWLYDLCNWLLDHVHWYHHVHPHPHSHPDAGGPSPVNTIDAKPDQTQIPVQQEQLKLLRDSLHKNLSRRVFLTGGGYSPGSNGVKPKDSKSECRSPLVINPVTGQGVIGDFKGRNRREGPVQIEYEII